MALMCSQTITPIVLVSNIAVKISVALQILPGVKFSIAQLVVAYLVLEVLRLVEVEQHQTPARPTPARLAHSCPESESVVGATGIGEREECSRLVIPVIQPLLQFPKGILSAHAPLNYQIIFYRMKLLLERAMINIFRARVDPENGKAVKKVKGIAAPLTAAHLMALWKNSNALMIQQ